MSQEIICQQGKCHEEGTVENELDTIYGDEDIVKGIEHDLMMNSIA